jgi:hypothetical protein
VVDGAGDVDTSVRSGTVVACSGVTDGGEVVATFGCAAVACEVVPVAASSPAHDDNAARAAATTRAWRTVARRRRSNVPCRGWHRVCDHVVVFTVSQVGVRWWDAVFMAG